MAKYTRPVVAQTLWDMNVDEIARRYGPKRGKVKCDPKTEVAARKCVRGALTRMSVQEARKGVAEELVWLEERLAILYEAERLLQMEQRRRDRLVDDVNTFLDLERADACRGERKASRLLERNKARS